ncbi:hypothetical protein CYMTET_23258 [Cymbomonas tetramitiformis]|uniref:Uncharacterized protein n=1 Tax=Cymbomonas tetramitiformis TaxID=36881 RepID=A0AAE0FY81_9CHLO|nr:hypothetical protein CYMTET_23258 [Cymbomonas tetramitiformis]
MAKSRRRSGAANPTTSALAKPRDAAEAQPESAVKLAPSDSPSGTAERPSRSGSPSASVDSAPSTVASPSPTKQKVKAELGKPGRTLANLPALPLNYKIGQEFRTPERSDKAKEEKGSNRSVLFSLVTVYPAEGAGEGEDKSYPYADSNIQAHQSRAPPVNLDRVMALLEPPNNFITRRKPRGGRRTPRGRRQQTPQSPQSPGVWTLPLISSTDQDGDRRGRMASKSLDSGSRDDGNFDTARTGSRENGNSKKLDSDRLYEVRQRPGPIKPRPWSRTFVSCPWDRIGVALHLCGRAGTRCMEDFWREEQMRDAKHAWPTEREEGNRYRRQEGEYSLEAMAKQSRTHTNSETALLALASNPAGSNQEVAQAEVEHYRAVAFQAREALKLSNGKESQMDMSDKFRSIFAPRRKECDAKDFYNTDMVKGKQLDLDWKRTIKKDKFRQFVRHNDITVTGEKDAAKIYQRLMQIQEVLNQHHDTVYNAFVYWCNMSDDIGEAAYQMSINEYVDWLREGNIPDKKSKSCRLADCDTIFISANFEEEKESLEADINDDRSLTRYEFLEVTVRLACAKFMKSNVVVTQSLTEAVDMLCKEHIAISIPPEAAADHNNFRRSRLYNRACENAVKPHMGALRGIYDLYKVLLTPWSPPFLGCPEHARQASLWSGHSRSRYLLQEDMVRMAEDMSIVNAETGITVFDVKLCFAHSQMVTVDDVLHHNRSVGLTLIDFIETLGRLGDLLSPPSFEETRPFFESEYEGPAFPSHRRLYTFYKYCDDVSVFRRDSAGYAPEKERPLGPKLCGMVELLLTTVAVNLNVKEEQLEDRIKIVLRTLIGKA